MGKKSNYFRHSLDAHNDQKLMRLLEQKNGLAKVGFYWTLLEIYGRSLMNDDTQNVQQEIHLKTLCNATHLRIDRVQNWLSCVAHVALIDTLCTPYDPTVILLSIPNFLKYFGRYDKTPAVKCPKKRKEKKRKEKKNIPSVDGVIFNDLKKSESEKKKKKVSEMDIKKFARIGESYFQVRERLQMELDNYGHILDDKEDS